MHLAWHEETRRLLAGASVAANVVRDSVRRESRWRGRGDGRGKEGERERGERKGRGREEEG